MKTKGKVCPIASFRNEKSSYMVQTCDEACAWFNKGIQCCAIIAFLQNYKKNMQQSEQSLSETLLNDTEYVINNI